MTNDQFHEIVRQVAAGCCMDDNWRGKLCPYHDGYMDGLERMWREFDPADHQH